jgi:hypothetical protein
MNDDHIDNNSKSNFSSYSSNIRDGAIICLIANLMEQLTIDRTADLYQLARKIDHVYPAFQNEVIIRHSRVSLSHKNIVLFDCMNPF